MNDLNAPLVRERIGTMAVRLRWITEDQLREALWSQRFLKAIGQFRRLGEILVQFNLVTENQITRLVDDQRRGVPADCGSGIADCGFRNVTGFVQSAIRNSKSAIRSASSLALAALAAASGHAAALANQTPRVAWIAMAVGGLGGTSWLLTGGDTPAGETAGGTSLSVGASERRSVAGSVPPNAPTLRPSDAPTVSLAAAASRSVPGPAPSNAPTLRRVVSSVEPRSDPPTAPAVSPVKPWVREMLAQLDGDDEDGSTFALVDAGEAGVDDGTWIAGRVPSRVPDRTILVVAFHPESGAGADEPRVTRRVEARGGCFADRLPEDAVKILQGAFRVVLRTEKPVDDGAGAFDLEVETRIVAGDPVRVLEAAGETARDLLAEIGQLAADAGELGRALAAARGGTLTREAWTGGAGARVLTALEAMTERQKIGDDDGVFVATDDALQSILARAGEYGSAVEELLNGRQGGRFGAHLDELQKEAPSGADWTSAVRAALREDLAALYADAAGRLLDEAADAVSDPAARDNSESWARRTALWTEEVRRLESACGKAMEITGPAQGPADPAPALADGWNRVRAFLTSADAAVGGGDDAASARLREDAARLRARFASIADGAAVADAGR